VPAVTRAVQARRWRAVIDVLLVEPDASQRTTLERLLERHGYTPRSAVRATDAVRSVRRHRPDVVLCEVQLPDMDGLDLCRQLRMSALPVLLMSGQWSERLQRDSRDAGALDLLGKPFPETLLLARLAHHLRLPVPPPGRQHTAPTLPAALMNRPGVLGVLLLDASGHTSEQSGQGIPDDLYRPFLTAARPDGEELLCLQLEYARHCLLIYRLHAPQDATLVCLLQNSSYASLVKYHLRASPSTRT